MDNKIYSYSNNMDIMETIIDRLMIIRTTQEIEKFEKALTITFLSMFPYQSEQGDIIEKMFRKYSEEHTVKEWYESLFKIKIVKKC